jgi:hypothetical protein
MIRLISWLPALLLAFALAGCSDQAGLKSRIASARSPLTPDQRDAEILGREIFDLVDRAVDYRGSHMGRPAANLPLMGVESLTPATVRRVVNLQREPIVTVAFRSRAGREIISCRGDPQILEDHSLNGRFTIMCTANSGAQRPMEVGQSSEP